jgi:drug/metabolite transporter (DMT)-like permease
MGGLDAASATLGAIAGAYCPGGMQTILNQLIIPLTMIGAVIFLGTNFDRQQIWGSSFILFGSMVASSNYFLNSSSQESSSASMSLAASVTLYFISVIPCALSNIYKERKMKEFDMNEVHTSTIVSFWQLWIGFIFLPLLSLPSLGLKSTCIFSNFSRWTFV